MLRYGNDAGASPFDGGQGEGAPVFVDRVALRATKAEKRGGRKGPSHPGFALTLGLARTTMVRRTAVGFMATTGLMATRAEIIVDS